MDYFVSTDGWVVSVVVVVVASGMQCYVVGYFCIMWAGERELKFSFAFLKGMPTHSHTYTHTNAHKRKSTGYRFNDNGRRSAAVVTGGVSWTTTIPRSYAVTERPVARRIRRVVRRWVHHRYRGRPRPTPTRRRRAVTDRRTTCVDFGPFFYLRTVAAYVSPLPNKRTYARTTNVFDPAALHTMASGVSARSVSGFIPAIPLSLLSPLLFFRRCTRTRTTPGPTRRW